MRRLLWYAAPVVALALVAGSGPAYAETPSPTPTPQCDKPRAFNLEVQPERVAAGDTVTITGLYRDLCLGEASQPEQTIALRAGTAQDTHLLEVARTTADTSGHFAFQYVVGESMQFQAEHVDGQQLSIRRNVAVDRVSGSCAGVVSLVPLSGHLGEAVHGLGNAPSLEGDFSDTGTVTIMIRRRNTTTFVEHERTKVPWDAGGHFYFGLTLDDDYALYAVTKRCDSPPVLARVQPSISGPASVRRGTPTTLRVTGLADAPVQVWFRQRGESTFVARRWGRTDATGTYVTSYRPDDDYRYYALVGNDRRQSNIGLTHAT
ncbi:MAG: hypothetical protein QOE05_2095 [Actinomycetota bacterium]|jgi:urease beta subunit|nr:hypothetical protein [Actinomycetota bacterium]